MARNTDPELIPNHISCHCLRHSIVIRKNSDNKGGGFRRYSTRMTTQAG